MTTTNAAASMEMKEKKIKSQRNRSVRIWFAAILFFFLFSALLLVFFYRLLSICFVRAHSPMRPSTDGHLTATFFDAIRLVLCVLPMISVYIGRKRRIVCTLKNQINEHNNNNIDDEKKNQLNKHSTRFTSPYFPLNNALNDAAIDKTFCHRK